MCPVVLIQYGIGELEGWETYTMVNEENSRIINRTSDMLLECPIGWVFMKPQCKSTSEEHDTVNRLKQHKHEFVIQREVLYGLPIASVNTYT